MTFLKQINKKILISILILIGANILIFHENRSSYDMVNANLIQQIITATPTPSATPFLGNWFDDLEYKIDSAEYEARCLKGVKTQLEYLNNESLSSKFTFDKYKITSFLVGEPKDLDINSNKFAREFRTMIRLRMAESGVNFAGHYSIVSVGMTGSGENFYIVDRSNGKAYTFLYEPSYMEFNKDSDLIIMNPKHKTLELIKNSKDYDEYCDPRPSWEYSDIGARPFYFLWQDNTLKLLGPTNIKPPINEFWKWYFD